MLKLLLIKNKRDSREKISKIKGNFITLEIVKEKARQCIDNTKSTHKRKRKSVD